MFDGGRRGCSRFFLLYLETAFFLSFFFFWRNVRLVFSDIKGRDGFSLIQIKRKLYIFMSQNNLQHPKETK